MSKTFTHAGVSKLDGEFKVRYANDGLRTKILIKNGHTDIDMVELKNPMTKEDAVAYLLSIDFANRDGKTNEVVQAALLNEVAKRTPKAAKPAKSAKAKPSMEGIKAKVAAKKAAPKSTVTRSEVEAQLKDMEDAPF